MRTRIYDVHKTHSGKRVVQSGTVSEWFVFGIIKFIFKIMFYLCFFWLIIPIKLLKRK